jgi:hypothetical protein
MALSGRAIGWVDAQLLVAALVAGSNVWSSIAVWLGRARPRHYGALRQVPSACLWHRRSPWRPARSTAPWHTPLHILSYEVAEAKLASPAQAVTACLQYGENDIACPSIQATRTKTGRPGPSSMAMTPARCKLTATILALAPFAPAGGSALKLDLGPVNLENGSRMEFNQSACDPVNALPFPQRDRSVVHVPLTHYEIFFRIEDIVLRKQLGFIGYLFYVRPKPADGSITECVISGQPSGSFRAQSAVVTFSVESDDGPAELSTMHLPILSFVDPPYLQALPRSEPEPERVEIGGVSEIPVSLENGLSGWPVWVDSATPLTGSKGKWRLAEVIVAGQDHFAPLLVDPGKNSNILTVRLEPDPGMAFWRTLLSGSGPRSVENVPISLRYHAELGSNQLDSRTLQIVIPVRLVPWPLLLPFALTFGTLLGSLIQLVAGRKGVILWLKVLVVSWVVAILSWLVAIFLVQHDSQLTLLGFTLEPFQLIPTALIGALAGVLGPKSLTILRRVIAALTGEKGDSPRLEVGSRRTAPGKGRKLPTLYPPKISAPPRGPAKPGEIAPGPERADGAEGHVVQEFGPGAGGRGSAQPSQETPHERPAVSEGSPKDSTDSDTATRLVSQPSEEAEGG